MRLLRPDISVGRAWDLEPAFFAARGIRLVLVDIDNTLTEHDSQHIPGEAREWLSRVRQSGVELVLVSNNSTKRVAPFARAMGLPAASWSLKPLTVNLRKQLTRRGIRPHEAAIVGDQLFSDVLGGNRLGVLTVKVEPITLEGGPYFTAKRRLEQWVLLRQQKETKRSNG